MTHRKRSFQLQSTGTIVYATIISAPRSTRNADKKRDPEMHQTRKGQQWYFGMKRHIGVDSKTGLAHSAVVTSANAHDKYALVQLLHGQERYRRLAKNATRSFVALGFANIYLARRTLYGQVRL